MVFDQLLHVVLWFKSDLSFSLSDRKILLLNKLELSLSYELLEAVWEEELVEEVGLDVCINLVLDGVNDTLEDSHVLDFGWIQIDRDFYLQLLSQAVLVLIVAHDLKSVILKKGTYGELWTDVCC